MSDIRKWFMKSHQKGNATESNHVNQEKPTPAKSQPEKPGQGSQESSGRRKTSKYFATDKQKPKDDKGREEIRAKRKLPKDNEESLEPPPKKIHEVDEDDQDLVFPTSRKNSTDTTPTKKLKSGPGGEVPKKCADLEESDADDDKDAMSPPKSGGRGCGGIGALAQSAGGRGRGGRGGGRGGFMNFGERKEPPNKGQKEVPEGSPDCLAGLTFVISGTLDSLEREEAEDLIKRHGGRVIGSVSKKTNFLLCDEDIGGRKSAKAKELGTAFLTEDGLFDMIRASKLAKAPAKEQSKELLNKVVAPQSRAPLKVKSKVSQFSGSSSTVAKPMTESSLQSSLMWTEKYRPKVPNDIIGNQSLVKQLHEWLSHWNEQFLDSGNRKKGKKQNESGSKKAVLLSGTPGIGKTTSAKLVSQMLGLQAIEVNASDSRGKVNSKIEKGIGGSNANSIKELVTNEALTPNVNGSKLSKTVLIMDEVDGMSAGDRGGIADLVASIKISKIPIICICNDRYSQKLKSLVNYCLLLSFRKPTKQQMAKRLMQVAKAEGLHVNEIALEELAERVNGDMRMALNQLHYMSLSMSIINYDDIRRCLLTSSKDEDISPFTAVDKLFGFNAVKLRMDERIDLSMSDPDLVPLLIQENYINYRPSLAGEDGNDVKRMNLIAHAAESIADGDVVNVQIRRYRQWQLSQSSSLASCIIPASLLHGQREILEQGERNYNRFGGWLGKNSTMGKNFRLLEDLHVHILASRESSSGRETLCMEYLTILLKQLTEPLRVLPKDEAVQRVVEFMNTYSISQQDFDTIVELSKFKGHPNPLDGIEPATKAALTKAYKEESKCRMVRAADLVTLPGMKRAPKKRIAGILEPAEGLEKGEGDTLEETEEENSSDSEELGTITSTAEKLESELQSLNSNAMQVQLDLKGTGNSTIKKTSGGRSKAASASADKGGQASRGGAKSKRPKKY